MQLQKNILICLLLCIGFSGISQTHPLLNLTKESAAAIRNATDVPPLFRDILEQTRMEVDKEIEIGVKVPIPKDMAGGYTHERHKQNFFILQKAGNLYQVTGEEKYAKYICDVLMEYAKIYPTLGKHPTDRSYATGKIFWQCLNDANWLVYVSQAYDCIYEWLKPKQRKYLNKTLFRPFADFISIENPQFFNRIHNHSTWGNAGVGMIGLVMNDEELVQRALYGLDKAIVDDDAKDNDGGLITLPTQKKAGFLAQIDHAFSPDGYYTEGPYYQRYAISPFILFAKALENNRKDVDIFNYREGLLKKSVFALLYQTNNQGEFFPINDAQKGMSFKSRELISAVNIVYDYCGRNPQLLDVSLKQGRVELDASGFAMAEAIAAGKSEAFFKKSIELNDGKNGDEGALGILRSRTSQNELCLAFKYTSQGLGHGHFDKLSYSMYGNNGEIIQDYGAARWVNIDQKAGGRYLPENKTWAKQTIAHNTVVINEQSHFGGDFKKGNEHHSDPYYFDASNEQFQIMIAKDNHAYDNVSMQRSLGLLKDAAFTSPLMIDIVKVTAPEASQFDLPLWFHGHMMEASFDYQSTQNQMSSMGKKHGYQHLWKEGTGKSTDGQAMVSWFEQNTFYSMTAAVSNDDELIFGRSGANDPTFHLRRDPCFIIRKKEQKDALFVSVIETHGSYDTVSETPLQPYGSINEVKVLLDTEDYTAIEFSNKDKQTWQIIIANQNNKSDATHKLSIGDKNYNWAGAYYFKKQ